MKTTLLLLIQLYWFFIPKNRRRKCIFNKSCSHFVYEKTLKEGLKSGIKALRYRYSNCRSGFETFKNPITDKTEMILLNGEVIPNHEIAKRLLNL